MLELETKVLVLGSKYLVLGTTKYSGQVFTEFMQGELFPISFAKLLNMCFLGELFPISFAKLLNEFVS